MDIRVVRWTSSESSVNCVAYTLENEKVSLKIFTEKSLNHFLRDHELQPYSWIRIENYCPEFEQVGAINLTVDEEGVRPSVMTEEVVPKRMYLSLGDTSFVILVDRFGSQSYMFTSDTEQEVPDSCSKILVNSPEEAFKKITRLYELVCPDRVISYKRISPFPDSSSCQPEYVTMSKCGCQGFVEQRLEAVCNKLKVTIPDLLSDDIPSLLKVIIRGVNPSFDQEVKVTLPEVQSPPEFGEVKVYNCTPFYLRLLKKCSNKDVRKVAKLLVDCPVDIVASLFYSSLVDRSELDPELKKFLANNSVLYLNQCTLVTTKVVKTLHKSTFLHPNGQIY